MLTKLPDYIISDCGFPNWDTEKEKINLAKLHENLWSTSSIWSTKSTNLAKLLPLRETLTDYYMDKLMVSQNESIYKTTATKSIQYCNQNSSNNSGRQALRHVNEVLKNGKRKQHQQKQHQQQQQRALDKRRSYANNLDKDLDQF